MSTAGKGWEEYKTVIESAELDRTVLFEFILPPGFKADFPYSLLLMNDGQDFPGLQVQQALRSLWVQGKIKPLIAIGIHAHDRSQEYGTAYHKDYKGRGKKAGAYTRFILHELIPFLRKNLAHAGFEEIVFAGCSLGGLSALDIAWNHPEYFSKIGVFSGSLWWRSKAYEQGYSEDLDRIMHNQVKATRKKPELKVWFQTGTLDETEDRNKNGIIDSIDDTLDLIREMEKIGYRKNIDVFYREVNGGRHDVATWRDVLPEFLIWAFSW